MRPKNFAGFSPQHCISGKVMRLNRLVANMFRKHLRPYGVSNSQVSLLFVLTKKKDLSQKQLCDITLLEKSSLNRNLGRLAQMGLITKADFPKINITEKGILLVNTIIPAWSRAMDEAEALFDTEGTAALNLLLRKAAGHGKMIPPG